MIVTATYGVKYLLTKKLLMVMSSLSAMERFSMSYNAGTAAQAVSRTLAALRVLRDSAGTDELNWIYDTEQQFGWLS